MPAPAGFVPHAQAIAEKKMMAARFAKISDLPSGVVTLLVERPQIFATSAPVKPQRSLLLAFSAPAFAADAPAAPTTKADCEKMKDMKWDAAKKVCVKK